MSNEPENCNFCNDPKKDAAINSALDQAQEAVRQFVMNSEAVKLIATELVNDWGYKLIFRVRCGAIPKESALPDDVEDLSLVSAMQTATESETPEWMRKMGITFSGDVATSITAASNDEPTPAEDLIKRDLKTAMDRFVHQRLGDVMNPNWANILHWHVHVRERETLALAGTFECASPQHQRLTYEQLTTGLAHCVGYMVSMDATECHGCPEVDRAATERYVRSIADGKSWATGKNDGREHC